MALRPSRPPARPAATRPRSARALKDNRWPRAVRVVRRGDFEAVYRGGLRRSSRRFVAFFRQNGLERSRFGASVKKALGGAVVRNRIRRRIREILRLHRSEIPTGWDIVIHPRTSVARAKFSDLAAELIALLQTIGH